MPQQRKTPRLAGQGRLECKERQLLAFDRSCGSSRKPVQSYLTAIILDATARGFHTFGLFSFEKSPKSNRIQAALRDGAGKNAVCARAEVSGCEGGWVRSHHRAGRSRGLGALHAPSGGHSKSGRRVDTAHCTAGSLGIASAYSSSLDSVSTRVRGQQTAA